MKKIHKIFDKKKTKKPTKKKKIQVLGGMVEGWMRFQEQDARTLRGIRNLLSFLLLIDLFLIFWYLKLPSTGMFFFIIIIVFLILTLIAERRQTDKMDETEEKESSQEGKEKKEEETILDPIEDIAGDVKKEMQDTIEQIQDDMEKVLPMF